MNMFKKVEVTSTERKAQSFVYVVSSPDLADEIVEFGVSGGEIVYVTAFEERAKKKVYVNNAVSYGSKSRLEGFDSGKYYEAMSQTANQWFNAGTTQYENEHYALAIEAYSRALNIDPNYIAARFNRSTMYFYLMEYQKPEVKVKMITLALEDAEKVFDATREDLNENPVWDQHLQSGGNRVMCYIALKNYHQAFLASDYLLQRWSKRRVGPQFEHYLHRGLAYTELGQYKAALVDFEHAVEIDNRHKADVYESNCITALYYYRGKAYLGLKNCIHALADFDRTLSSLSDRGRDVFLGRHGYIQLELDIIRAEREAANRCLT